MVWRGVECWPFPLTCFVAFKTLSHYSASVWLHVAVPVLTVVSQQKDSGLFRWRFIIIHIAGSVRWTRPNQFNFNLVTSRHVDHFTRSLVTANDRFATVRRLTFTHDGIFVTQCPRLQLLHRPGVCVRVWPLNLHVRFVMPVSVVVGIWTQLVTIQRKRSHTSEFNYNFPKKNPVGERSVPYSCLYKSVMFI